MRQPRGSSGVSYYQYPRTSQISDTVVRLVHVLCEHRNAMANVKTLRALDLRVATRPFGFRLSSTSGFWPGVL
jgi:hypothetical protein